MAPITIAKMRAYYRDELKLRGSAGERDEERANEVAVREPPKQVPRFDDKEFLEKTIQKACQPVKRHSIIVLDKPPVPVSTSSQQPKATPSSSICQARNINGTPCKCKAKIGKFCSKHAP
jgi:hypothetical protein